MPFEKLVEELAPERSLAHAPLFQVMLVLQNAPAESLEIEDLRLRPVSVNATTAKFDLTLNLAEHDGGLTGTVEYATDLFDAPTIDRLVRPLRAAAGRGPGSAGSAGRGAAAARRGGAAPAAPGVGRDPGGACLAFRRSTAVSRRAPGRPPRPRLLTCGEVTLTYGELHRRSNQLARWLRGQGAGPESRVGLCLDRSVDLVVGILGVLKAGAAYVPLDPGSPPERLAFIVEDADIRIVVGAGGDRCRWRASRPAISEPLGDASSLAYVIYTSGSTGRPKGALITHGNVTRLFDATEAWFGFGERDVWTLFHSYAFDFSVWEIWGALLYGGRLVIVPWEVSRSPELFLDLLARERVTVLNQTPSAFAQLAQEEGAAAAALPALRLVIFGGEALDPASLEPWFARHGDTRPRLVNMYGITETTVHVTYRPLSAADARGGHRSVIGVPIPDLSLAVLDRSLHAGPHRRAGRAGGRRRRAGPRLSGPAGADRGALRSGPVRRPAGSAALPVGRPGAFPPQRRGGVPRPARPPGEDPRLPHRAGRDRGGAGGAARSPRGGGAGARWIRPIIGRPAAGRLRRRRRHGRGAAPGRCASGCRTTWCRPPS